MASKYEDTSPIPENDASDVEELIAPTESVNDFISKSRPGIRSQTFTPESSAAQGECRMRNKTVRVFTENAFELISEDDDKEIEWETVNWIMVAMDTYTSDGKKDTIVRKGKVLLIQWNLHNPTPV